MYLYCAELCSTIPCCPFFSACDAGKYGVNCQEDCSRHCPDSGNCDHQDGTCSPCVGWIIGNKCDVELGEEPIPISLPNIGLIKNNNIYHVNIIQQINCQYLVFFTFTVIVSF